MVENSTVLDWLSTLPPTPSAGPQPGQPALDEKRSRKRKRSSVSRSPHRLPSPPFSLLRTLSASCTGVRTFDTTDLDPESDQGAMNPHQADASATTTPTRNLAQRLPPNPDATDLDLEPTPRPMRADLILSLVARQMAQSDTSGVASSSAASQTSFQTSSSTSRKRKRQSSPRKHTNLMAIENSIDYISFDGRVAPPPALYRLLNRIETLGRGVGIVSRTQEVGHQLKSGSASPGTNIYPSHRHLFGPKPRQTTIFVGSETIRLLRTQPPPRRQNYHPSPTATNWVQPSPSTQSRRFGPRPLMRRQSAMRKGSGTRRSTGRCYTAR